MSEVGEDAVIAALEEALEAQLIVEEAGSGGTVYAFRHALVRETLYGGLSAPRRQRIHARAAQAIEGMRTAEVDAQIAALAVHYRLAGPVVDPAKGIEYSLRAGDRARQLFAWEETRLHWDGALALMDRAEAPAADRARLLVRLADMTAIVGEVGPQIDYLERALALYSELGDEEHAAQAHSRLGLAYSLVDTIYADHFDLRRASRHFDAARTVLDRGPVRRARGHLETGVGTALTYGLRIQPGLEASRRAMAIAEELGDEASWTAAMQAYSWHTIIGGNLAAGFDAVKRAFDAADRGQLPFLAWMATSIGGQMRWGLGDPDAAQRVIERPSTLPYTDETAFRQHLADSVGRCHVSRGEVAEARALVSDAKPVWATHSLKPLIDLWNGDWEAVAALAAQVLATSRRTGNRWDEWASHHIAARVHSLRGEPAAAADALERARRIVVDGGARYFEMWVLPDLARAQVDLGNVGEARVHVDRVREICAGGEDWRGRRGTADIAESVVLSAEGRHDEAAACFAGAFETLRRYKLRTDEADCLHEWGLALMRAGERAGALEKLDAAEGIYRDGGAGAPWLERIEAARAVR
jgi:tetratricopeptide (TPR) repeat protein